MKKNFKIKKKLFIFVFLFIGILSYSQVQISLDELLNRVSQENLELKTDSLQNHRESLEGKYAYSVGNTSLTAGYGQYNSSKMDYQAEVLQDLGNLFSYKKAQDAADSKVKWLEAKRLSKTHLLQFQVERLYNEWLYIFEKRKLYKKMDSLYQIGLVKARNRYKQGEIDYVEEQFFKTEREQIVRQKVTNEKEYLNIRNQLVSLCNLSSNGDYIPVGNFIKEENIYKNQEINPLFTEEFNRAVIFNEKNLEKEKAQKRTPHLSIGLISQSLDKSFNYFAPVVGLNMPLFANSYKKAKEQVEIDNMTAEHQKQQTIKVLELKKEQLENELKIYEDNLQSIGSQYEKDLEKMRRAAQMKYQYGEIDYIQYSSLLKSSIDAQLNYLSLVDDYNLAIIELKYITIEN